MNYNSKSYEVLADSFGRWKADLPRPSLDGSYPISITSFFHPTNKSTPSIYPFLFDVTAPKPTHAKVNSNIVTLTFEQELSTSFIDNTRFKINYGIGNYVVTSSTVSDDLLEVTLNISNDLPSNLDVSISYSPKFGSSSNLEDSFGNPIDAFYSLVPSTYVASDHTHSLATQYTQLIAAPDKPLLLTGNPLSNNIIGNNADNIISGQSGADILTGLDGRDSFVYESITDSVFGSSGSAVFYDRITDFNFSSDRLVLPSQYKGSISILGELNELSSNNIAMLAESVNLQPYAISLITYGQRSFLLINDKLNAFNPKADGFIEITGYSGNINSYIIA